MKKSKKPIILIVDDVPKNIQVLGTLLGKFECELAVAMNGQQALETVAKVKPDLILLDVMMPIMDGYEVCRRLKSVDETKNIPIIFLTAKVETEDIVTGFKLGAVDYITKPFISSELLARVKTHLSLKKIQQTLKEEVISKNKFFSIMSHDLRGSFGIIMNFVQLIQGSREELSNEEVNELLDDIEITSKNTLDLLENLLKWARSQTGKIQYYPQNLNIDELFIEIGKMHKNIAQAKSIEIIENLDNRHMVFGDKNMLLLIIRNLVSNAIKFTRSDGRISINTEDYGEYIKITIADNGVGIDEKTINKLFDINTNSSMNGTNNEMGSGLGLILCKEFVTINNGEIGIDSKPNEGTNVWFTVPKTSNRLN